MWKWVSLACAVILLFTAGTGFILYTLAKNIVTSDGTRVSVHERIIQSAVGNMMSFLPLLPEFLGYTKPHTYLFLFANNTELRPSGGFIGSYAVVHIDKGKIDLRVLEGSEVLDKTTPDAWRPQPPEPLTDHLGVDKWYFRDSNWSPDFPTSAEQALTLYAGEQGVDAKEIDMVVVFTVSVLEALMRVIGPVEIQGLRLEADTIVSELQYATGYDYSIRGYSQENRKGILKNIFVAIMQKAKDELPENYGTYISLFKRLVDERHIAIYARDETIQTKIDALGWAGRVKNSGEGDYALWVDANLASLKTDHAIERTLEYHIEPRADGRYVATASMRYVHTGMFDWRTTRYRTYARLFVPKGSELLSSDGSMKWDRSTEPGVVYHGEELGRQWFGTFIAIEPGRTGTLTFTYLLPLSVSQMIEHGTYTLFVQKQLGTIQNRLTLNLDFGTLIHTALPAEESTKQGDSVYQQESDLRVDREFSVTF